LGADQQWTPVENVLDTGKYERVYNLRVADYHTYFIGSQNWGFSVWAHNVYRLNGDDDALNGLSILSAERADRSFQYTGAYLVARGDRHHPFARMFLRAMDEAGFDVGSGARTQAQQLARLDAQEHADLHSAWNAFVTGRGFEELATVEGNTLILQSSLEMGRIKPQQIFSLMEEFYSNQQRPELLRSVRILRTQLGIDQLRLF
jgi:hypothetical protein